MQTRRSLNKGFTLLEILLVVATISILAGIVILAINPTKQLGDTRNAQRKADVSTILNAVYQYSLDNNGTLPASIIETPAESSNTEICRIGSTCTGLTDLSILTTNEKYLVSIPVDPSVSSGNSTKYSIHKSVNGRVTVSALNAEQTASISASK